MYTYAPLDLNHEIRILHHQTSNGHQGKTILGNKKVKMEFLVSEMSLSYLKITEFGL